MPTRRDGATVFPYREGDALAVDEGAAEDDISPGGGVESSGMVDELDG